MNKETNEQNRNEKDISHRILSWCGEHKMQIGIITLIGLLFLTSMYLVPEQSIVDITVDWDTSVGGQKIPHHAAPSEPMIEIAEDTFAKLNVKVNAENPHAGDTSQPANILIYCRVAKKDSGVQFQMNGKIYPDEFSFPAQQFYTPKATYEFSILIKAPLDEDLYANKVEICARIDSSLETCEPVWLRIIGAKDTPIPSPTQSPATQLTPFQAIVVIVSIVIAIGFVYWLAGDRNGKKKKKHSGQKK